ncbi:MAG: ATP-binding cassette domain-containing protein [Prevotellaceae bacterium]|jgi:phospholipid/cholesterol/gamma-HCH transport system ATP-binding protein|nr:ATP-binding cassette domain-containing protein [Prevotellaceae bacterium]
MIEVQNISKSFDGKLVLDDISATFHSGKINQIIGQSGSGKTVLMKSIIGLFRVDSGKILYDGRNLREMRMKEIKELRKEVGMLFQGSALFDSQTVLANVMFPLKMFSPMSVAEMTERAEFCLTRVDLKPQAFNLFPSEISGGMQKRVAIARAISLNPRYLFCDEPNSGLDPVTSILIDRLIEEITQEFDITTIVNTHDMNSIMEIGANIILINKGKKAWEGSKDTIFSSDNEALNDFVFASELFKNVKKTQLKNNS